MSTAEELCDPPGVGLASFRILETAGDEFTEAYLDDLRRRLQVALQDFPELTGHTVSVGLADPDDGRFIARADWLNNLIFIPMDEYCSNLTLWHELGHLAIHQLDERGADVPPTSEEFCSIFSVARMDPEHLDRDRIAYLGYPDEPRGQWPGVCRSALSYREKNRNYIQKCKEWLDV